MITQENRYSTFICVKKEFLDLGYTIPYSLLEQDQRNLDLSYLIAAGIRVVPNWWQSCRSLDAYGSSKKSNKGVDNDDGIYFYLQAITPPFLNKKDLEQPISSLQGKIGRIRGWYYDFPT